VAGYLVCFFFFLSKKKRRDEVWREIIRRYWNINLKEMLETGVYFGHATRKWKKNE
jgi:small subunit ribosomal protein S2